MKKGDTVLYQNKLCTIWRINQDKYDLLLPERNVELDSLSKFCDRDYGKNDFVLYSKNNTVDVALIVSLDLYYKYAQVRILKTKVHRSLCIKN